MLRTLVIALFVAVPTAAMAEEFPRAMSEQVVRGHDGSELGRISDVEYDEDGNIIAAAIPGLEPGDAPQAPSNLVAERRLRTPANARSRAVSQSQLENARASGRLIRAR